MPNWMRMIGVATLAALLAFGGVAGATMNTPQAEIAEVEADEVPDVADATMSAPQDENAEVEVDEVPDAVGTNDEVSAVSERSAWVWTIEEIEALRELALAHLAEKSGETVEEVEARLVQKLEEQHQEALAQIEAMQEKWAEMRDAAIEKWEAMREAWEEERRERREARQERHEARRKHGEARKERAQHEVELQAVVDEPGEMPSDAEELWMPRPVRVIDREQVLEWAEKWIDEFEVPEREVLREQWDALVERFLGSTEGAVDEVKEAGRKWIDEQRDLLDDVWSGLQELRNEIYTILTESVSDESAAEGDQDGAEALREVDADGTVAESEA